MLKNKKLMIKIVICFLLVPVALMTVPYLISPIIPEKYGQMTVDLIIFLIVIILSRNIWHVRIHFFSGKRIGNQLCQLIPAVIFLILTRFGTLSSIAPRLINVRIILTVLLVALAEEGMFRGLLLPLSLELTRNRRYTAVIISSLGFAVAHLANIANSSWSLVLLQMIVVFGNGLLWGSVYLKTDNLSLTILLHFLDDLPLFITNGSLKLTTPTSSQLMTALVMYLVMIGIIGVVTFLQVNGLHRRPTR
ncbi:CPBP family intramembrane glutamic endopeptidase [Lactiplantibacillus pentosus]|uniref:CPBP family intramembrane glutamic endopeptidase n=1 Tax=Lactiplantibacillus pentosus TaxID=1589 RepID=UPI000B545F8E|nr:CPBP family intramembrane glutamic endopeptidase [Lactiplantibacillus pentosus]ASG79482.1 CPBP family intramembrane metalloprotease [Lactiplantibacillus pentosus]MDO7803465.1 CPBP family intramembrane metalloprotease [Lactiplantibacillus pentosus]WFC03602.1 CPBP family intramembrane metalloprotease [Lactiplantibacillus pentosus]